MSNTLLALLGQTVDELRAHAARIGAPVPRSRWKDGLATAIAHHQRAADEPHFGCGVLEVHDEGFGFLRSPDDDFLPGVNDIYVSQSQIRRFRLRTGDAVVGRVRPPKEQERYPALLRVELINGDPADVEVIPFEQRTAVHPSTRLPLAREPMLALVDHVAPLGLGARGMVLGGARSSGISAGPDRAEVLRRLAHTFGTTDGLEVWVLLIGARPEDITEWRENTPCEVIATPFDEIAARHLHVADITLQRARRLAERGVEVMVLVDSWTRLLRFAVADAQSEHPRTLEGVDAGALQRVRGWVATGRDLRDAGSVTVIGTVSTDPTDTLSAVLRRDLAEAITWQLSLRDLPGAAMADAIDVHESWTRRDERLLAQEELERRRRWRAGLPPGADEASAALRSLGK